MSSILVLPDDVLSHVLSLLPLDFCTGLSDRCHRMMVIVQQRERREERRRMRKVESDQLLSFWDPKTGVLHDPDSRIDKIRMRDGWKETGLVHILTTFPHIQLSADAWAYETYVDHFERHAEDERLIRSRITNFRTNAGILNKLMDMRLGNLTRLRIWGRLDREELRQILQSYPKLTKLDIMTEVENMDLLSTSGHQLQVFKLHDTSEEVTPGNHVHLFRFLERKGHILSHLELTCRKDQPTGDLITVLCRTCRNLEMVKIFKFLTNFYLEYEENQLRLWPFSEESIQPLIQLFPRTRSFVISTHSTNIPCHILRWIQELEMFAATKRRRMIRAEIRMVTSSPATTTTDHNLHLTVINHY